MHRRFYTGIRALRIRWVLLKLKNVSRGSGHVEQKAVTTPKLHSQIQKSAFVCSGARRPQIYQQCVAPQYSLPHARRISDIFSKSPSCKRGAYCHIDHLECHASSVWVAEAAVPERTKSKWQKYFQLAFNQVKQIAKVYQLNVESDISSWRMALTQDVHSLCACIIRRLCRGSWEVWDLSKGLSFHWATSGN